MKFKADWGSAVWEVRSVNQRFLETYFRLPEQFKSMEPVLRERFRKQLQRGKVECSLRFVANDAAVGKLNLNEVLAKQVMKAADWVQSHGQSAGVNPLRRITLAWCYFSRRNGHGCYSSRERLAEFDLTLKGFIAARATEGSNLKGMIEQRLDGINAEVEKVTSHMPDVIKWQREKIQARFEDAKIDLDPARVEQEMVMLAQKSRCSRRARPLNITHKRNPKNS